MTNAQVYLSTIGLVAAQRISDFINDISGGALRPSKATILAFQKEVSAHLDDEIEAIRESILNSPVLHIDETPHQVNAKACRRGPIVRRGQSTRPQYLCAHIQHS